MSRATLYVQFPDGTVRYGLYNGTSDYAWPKLYATPEEAWDAYDSQPRAGEHPGVATPVRLATDYGHGFSWPGMATQDEVTAGHDAFGEGDGYESGLPAWAVYP